ncbi:cycloheximide resistance [Purpureocillium lilacinum]|nr:cycloheximide resistance [Purpureocillium lilacinum]OAQ87827.1 cycloheximide resistance [Purpureocillium lilacinum]OAQ89872.1 cycloheximide resistance [Purpureocillium lilacinum]
MSSPTSPVPMTTSTRSLSFGSFASHQKPIKYGKGRHSDVELVPQPSDDPEDPLNWPRWRKDVNLVSLLMTVGLVGGMKTAFITTGGTMAVHYNVSFTSIAALTAVPMILSTFTGLISVVAAKFWGKRPMYLASMVLLFIGSIWNMTAGDSYGSCMGARVVQGLGWGAFDTLVMGSIQDTYYEHERNLPVSLYNIFCIATTWGSPLFGGLASQNAGSFTAQFRIINSFHALAIPLLAFGAPETAFDRSWSAAVPPSPVPWYGAPPPWRPWRLRHRLNKDTVIQYIRSMKPVSFEGALTLPTMLQVPRALIAPTTCLLFLLSFIPYGTLWGITLSLTLLTTPAPLSLSSTTVGTLMAGPWIFATAIVAGFCFYRGLHQKFNGNISYTTVAAGTLLIFVGLLTFGLGLDNFMAQDASGSVRVFFAADTAGQISLPLISFQLGALAGGFYVIDTATRPLLARSASFTSSSIIVAQRSIGDMHTSVILLRNFAAGVIVLAMPSAISAVHGLKAAVIGFSVTQMLLAAAVVTLWRLLDESIWRADGKIMGLVDLRLLKQSVSFFDHD